MEISALRQRLAAALLTFVWDEWAQMGVLAAAPAPRRWAQDPEALMLLTLEVARDDPRLFDEVLDWYAHNERLVSARRLRTLCEDAEDRQLASAAIDWVARELRRGAKPPSTDLGKGEPVPLFRDADGTALPVLKRDEVFLAHGLVRPPAVRTKKSSDPDLSAPINFAFRLRHLLGMGARAEAMRYLLTVESDSVTVAEVAASSGYAKRNVQEALSSLQAAGTASVVVSRGEQRFAVDRPRWAFLLGQDTKDLPMYRDWRNLLGALRQMLRWLARPDLDSLSDYIRASQAADLLDEVRPRLNQAGIVLPAWQGAERTWQDLEDTVDTALWWLAPPSRRAAPARFELVESEPGRFAWRLTGEDGRIVAQSAESYSSAAAARSAVKRMQNPPGAFSVRASGDSGAFRWILVAENGRVLGASGELFATTGDAERATRSARDLVLGATPPAENGPVEVVGETRRHISRQPNGRWRVEVEGATHAASTHLTKAEAIHTAELAAQRAGGDSVLLVHEPNGDVRASGVFTGKK